MHIGRFAYFWVLLAILGFSSPALAQQFNTNDGSTYNTNDSAFATEWSSSSDTVTIKAAPAGTGSISWNNGLTMSSGGSVGIGTTTPGSKLDVSGTIVSRANNAAASTSIDWAQGNAQYTTANCGAFTFTNMQDGGSYTLAVQGTTVGTCSFTHTGLTFRLPSNHGATTSGKMTIYSFIRLGANVFVTWNPGY